MEIKTSSPFGEPAHTVITRPCGHRGCRASTPCVQHEQVVLRFNVDGIEPHEAALLSKLAFMDMAEMHKDPREFFHMLAEFVLLANQQHDLKPIMAPGLMSQIL